MKVFIIVLTSIGLSCSLYAQHAHLNVGAVGQNPGDQLFFANGAEYADSSGYVKTLLITATPRYAGYFEGNITLTALSSTLHLQAAAPGSYIQFGLSNVSGPPGGAFNFWESTGDVPAITLAPGEGSASLFGLSESDGSPGSDPHGHIHNRRFTATKAGIYKIGFQAFDTSANGANGGPIHPPSDWIYIYFQAGANIQSMTLTGQVSTVRYGARAGTAATLEYSTNLAQPNDWFPAAPPQGAEGDRFQTIDDPEAVTPARFYRLRIDPIPQ